MTPVDCGSSGGSGTWSRSGPPKKEELVGGKKKGRTWGPSSTLQKERAGGEERLKALGEGSKQWSSSAPNLGKSPKHTPMAPGFASLNEMGKRMGVLWGVMGTGEVLAEGTSPQTEVRRAQKREQLLASDWLSISEARLWKERLLDDSGT